LGIHSHKARGHQILSLFDIGPAPRTVILFFSDKKPGKPYGFIVWGIHAIAAKGKRLSPKKMANNSKRTFRSLAMK
jgi:hypothetical protein